MSEPEKKEKKKPKHIQEAFDGAVTNTEGLDVEKLMKIRRQYALEEQVAAARKSGTDVNLLPALYDEGVMPYGEGFKSDKHQLSATIGIKETKTISRAKLILAGVDADVIDACTVTSYSEPFVSLRSTAKGGDDDE